MELCPLHFLLPFHLYLIPLPSILLPLSRFLSFLSFHCPEGDFPKFTRGIWINTVSSPSGPGRNLADKRVLMHCELKITFHKNVIFNSQCTRNRFCVSVFNWYLFRGYSAGSCHSMLRCKYHTNIQKFYHHGNRDFQLTMHQHPFVGQVSSGPAGGAHSADPDS